MLLTEGFVLLEASHPDLKHKYKTLSACCCLSSSPPLLLHHIITLIPHKKVSFFLTRQSVGRGPVQPAAQCSLQQSLGEGPLHLLEHCCAQFSFVTGNKIKTESVQSPVASI